MATFVMFGKYSGEGMKGISAERTQKERSERLIRQLLEARDDERTRIIGALHDDLDSGLRDPLDPQGVPYTVEGDSEDVEAGAEVGYGSGRINFNLFGTHLATQAPNNLRSLHLNNNS